MSKIIGNTVGTTMNPKKIASEAKPQYGAMHLSGDANGGSINAWNSENPHKSVLEISSYTLKFEGNALVFDVTSITTGLKVATPTEDSDAVNKGYVDNLVGDVETALETVLDRIIEMQETLIGGEA